MLRDLLGVCCSDKYVVRTSMDSCDKRQHGFKGFSAARKHMTMVCRVAGIPFHARVCELLWFLRPAGIADFAGYSQ